MNPPDDAARHASPPADPLRFHPGMEQIEAGEGDTQAALDASMRGIRETTLADTGHAIRSVHAKSHGLLRGTLTVPPGLPPVLAQGMFARPGSYQVVMRFSTLPGDLLPDDVSTPRGVALKVIGVDGPRLPGSEHDTTQDFVMVNGPAFVAPTAAGFLGSLKLLAATTDKATGLKEVVSKVARGTESLLEAFGGKSATLVTMGGQPATQILGDSFYTQTPFLFGDHVGKFSLAPVSPALTALTNQPLDVAGRPNALRESVIAFFKDQGGEWELRVQLATELATMPIEDASVAWPEDASPYVAVARISVPPQDAWSQENVAAIDDGLSFSPWHGLAAHRPLGSVNRARKNTYRHSAAFRAQQTGCPMHEPAAAQPAD